MYNAKNDYLCKKSSRLRQRGKWEKTKRETILPFTQLLVKGINPPSNCTERGNLYLFFNKAAPAPWPFVFPLSSGHCKCCTICSWVEKLFSFSVATVCRVVKSWPYLLLLFFLVSYMCRLRSCLINSFERGNCWKKVGFDVSVYLRNFMSKSHWSK